MKFLKIVKCNLHVKNTRNFGGWASQIWYFQKNHVLRYYFQKNHVLRYYFQKNHVLRYYFQKNHVLRYYFQKNHVLRYYFQKNHVLPSFKTAILTVFPRKHSCLTLSIYIFKSDSSKNELFKHFKISQLLRKIIDDPSQKEIWQRWSYFIFCNKMFMSSYVHII